MDTLDTSWRPPMGVMTIEVGSAGEGQISLGRRPKVLVRSTVKYCEVLAQSTVKY
jgi:hypothetical protein